jgi:hypothetical protein
MKPTLLFLFIIVSHASFAQKLDSIYFNLYTDSLKKGTHNYINVEGKYKNGRILPVDNSEVIFEADSAKFVGNSVWLPMDFKPKFVKVWVTVKAAPQKKIQISIPIKQKGDDEILRSEQEIINSKKKKKG